MNLDIKKNEMVFTNIGNPKEFRACLQAPETIKFREVGGWFYVPMEYLQETRLALRDYKNKISLSVTYMKFAKRFVQGGPIVIDWHPAVSFIRGAGLPFDRIMPATSYFDKAAIRSKAYEQGKWDGRRYLFDVLSGTFPSGLLERILKILNEQNIPYTLNRKFEYPQPYLNIKTEFEFDPTQDQIDAVAALDKHNCGIAKLPTGFGKTSFVAAALIAKKGVRSMFLANQRVLVNDAKNDFKSVFKHNPDLKIGTIGDGEYDPGDITVASIQGVVAALKPPTALEIRQAEGELQVAEFRLNGDDSKEAKTELKKLRNRVENKKERVRRSIELTEFLKSVDLFIVDESQVLGTDMWNAFLHACPAPYRYTLSATDTRTDGGRIQIVAATGERRFESSAAEQIEKGRLAEFKAFFKYFDHGIPKDVLKDMHLDFHQAYNIFIVNNYERNSFLCDVMINWMNEKFSVLGLVTRIEHAERVIEILESRGLQQGLHFEYVDGKTPKKQREQKIANYRAGKFPILLGTSIFDVGFNAKNASKIVRFNAGASEVRETQRAGRTVRMREDGSRGESMDIIDLNVPFFMQQGFKRMKLLKEEFGAERVEILPGKIKTTFEISKLEEVVEAIPNQTDQQQLRDLIDRVQGKGFEDVGEWDATPIIKDKDLMDLLDEIQTDFDAIK